MMVVKIMVLFSYWILHTLAWIPLAIIAWIVVPIATLSGAYEIRESKINQGQYMLNFTWDFMYIWSNETDGIKEGWGDKDYETKLKPLIGPKWAEKVQILYWSLIRNPVNNARFTPYMSIKPNPSEIQYIASDGFQLEDSNNDKKELWYLVWQGNYGSFRKHFRMGNNMYRIWIGWKLRPSDTLGIKEDSWRKNNVGFAYQFRRSVKDVHIKKVSE